MVDKKATLIIQLKDLASKGMSRIGGSMAKLGNWVQKNKIQFALLGAGIGFLGKKMLDAADKMEQWSISFETMIGNAGDAKRLMEEIKDFAKETPFELPDVVKGAKSLLAYGVALEDIIPSLKMMGDVSAGLGVPMERLILNFGQVKAQAKLTGRELRDFAVAGVPMLATLAQNLNKTESEISDMVSKGKIGFKDVEQAFKSMSGEGGRFNNLMQKQMGTLTGVVSNLQDSIFQLAAEFGETMLPTAKDIALSIGGLIEKFKTHKDQYAAFIDMIVFWAETVVSMFVFVGQTVGTVFGQMFLSVEAFWLVLTGRLVEGLTLFKDTTFDALGQVKDEWADMFNGITKARDKMDVKRKKRQKKEIKEEIKHTKAVAAVQKTAIVTLNKLQDDHVKLYEEQQKIKKQNTLDTLNYISSLSTAKNKQLAMIGKAAAISTATIDMWAGVGKAWALGPIIGPPMAAMVAAAGTVNIAKIAGVQLAEGGVVMPTGGGTVATIGEAGKAEAVIPLDDDEAQEKMGGIGDDQITVNMNIGTLVADDTALEELAETLDEKLYELQRSRRTVAI